MAEEKKIVLSIETITDQSVMQAYGQVLNDVLGSYEDNIALIAQYNAQMKDNQARIKEIEKATEAYGRTTKKQAEELARLTAENAKLKQAKAELVQITKNQEKIDITQAGTMENQSHLLGKLREAWRAMTDEQKAANQGMLETIQQLDAGLKRSDAEIGNFQRNVGNYAGGIAQALARLDILPEKAAKYISAIGKLQGAYKELSGVIGSGAVPAVKAFIGSLNGVRGAMMATGIGALVALVGVLVVHFDELTAGTKEAVTATEEYRIETEKLAAQASSSNIVRVKELALAYSQLGDNLDAKKSFVTDFKDELGNMGIEMNNVNDADRIFVEQTGAYIKALQARAKADAIKSYASKKYEEYLTQIAKKEGIVQDLYGVIYDVAKNDPLNGGDVFFGFEDRLDNMTADQISQTYIGVLPAIAKGYKRAKSDIASLKMESDAVVDELIKSAQKYEAEANKLLKPKGKGGGGGKSGKTDAEKAAEEAARQRERDLADIKRAERETELALMDGEERELSVLEEKYNKQLALFQKYGKDTTQLTERYNKEKAAIEKKYRDAEEKAKKEAEEKAKKEADKATAEAEKTKQKELAEISKYSRDAELALMTEKEREIAIVKEKYNEQIALFQKYGKDITKLKELLAKELANIDEKYDKTPKKAMARALGVTDEDLKKINQQALQAAGQLFNSIAQIANNATQRRLDDDLEAVDREAESEKAILEAKLEKGIISQKEYEKKLGELDEETAARKEELNKEAFQKQKAWNIGQALMNAALAITKTFAEYGGTPFAFITAAITAATTAAEIGVIASQKYARGGELHGASHANGGIKGFVGNRHIEAEGGEIIINKRSSAKHRKLLSLINSDNGWGDDFANSRGGSGRFFARGGVLGGYDFRTSALPDTRGGLAQFAKQQTANIENAISALNKRIDNIRVYLPLSDIEQRSNEKRVHVSRAVL